MTDLPPGANAPLPAPRVTATVSCAVPVDVSALLVGPGLRVRSDADLVFFNAPEGPGVRWADAGGRQRVRLDLDAVPAGVHAVLIAVSLAGAGTFGAMPPPQARLTDDEGETAASFTVPGLGPDRAIVALEIYRRDGQRMVRAVGPAHTGRRGHGHRHGHGGGHRPAGPGRGRPAAPAGAVPTAAVIPGAPATGAPTTGAPTTGTAVTGGGAARPAGAVPLGGRLPGTLLAGL